MIITLILFLSLFGLSLLPWPALQKHLLKAAALVSALGLSLLALDFASPSASMSASLAPQLGLWIDFEMGGLSWAFASLVLLIGIFVFIYADSYLEEIKSPRRFNSAFLLFTTAMLGLVLADNLFLFFLFWEMTSLSSYLLISLKDEKSEARESSRLVFLVTLLGGFFLLAALLWMQQIGLQEGLSLAEASQFSHLLELSWAQWHESSWILLLLIIAAASKSAQFPFHFWLPLAMTAPTPVSSFLHSATMVKAGIFLLAKVFVAFHSLPLWGDILIPLGLLTAVWSALLCVSERDLKKILAWSTVSVLGILTLLLGLGTELAIKSFVVFLFAHALYKASLFQVAGNIDSSTGSRDLDKLNALYPALKWTAIAGALAALSKAGAPPFLGFIGKELVLKTKIAFESYEVFLLGCAVLINSLLMLMALLIGFKTFFARQSPDRAQVKKSLPILRSLAPLSLALLGLLIGLFPSLFDSTLGQVMVSDIMGQALTLELKLWHGMKPAALTALGLSLLTFAIGAVLLARFSKWKESYRRIFSHLPVAATLWDISIQKLVKIFEQISQWQLQRSLSASLLIMGLSLASVVFFVTLPLNESSPVWTALHSLDRSIHSTFLMTLFVVTIAASVSVLFIDRFVIGAVVLGLVGVVLAIVFSWFGAADLAMTQILAELLVAVLMASFGFKLARMPRHREDHYPLIRGAGALTVGASLFLLAAFPAETSVTFEARDYFLNHALSTAFGQNVVNVILVDFRAMDTLIEVIVVLLAGFGVARLLQTKKSVSAKGAR